MTAVYQTHINDMHRVPAGYMPHMGGPGCADMAPHVLQHVLEVQCMRQEYSFRFRDSDNASPRSVASCSSYGSFQSPSPRAVDSPSPPTPASANKLYNLLKNPTTASYNVEDTWADEPINFKRKSYDEQEEPVDLTVRHKRPRLDAYSDVNPEAAAYNGNYVMRSHQQNPLPYPTHDYNQCHIPNSVAQGTSGYRNCSPSEASSPYPNSGRKGHASRSEMVPVYHTVRGHEGIPRQRDYRVTYTASPYPSETRPRFQDRAQNTPLSSTPQETSTGSLLHSILSGGCLQAPGSTPTDTASTPNITNSTNVCLAKKNLLPVTARVSDWVVKIIDFAQAIPEFNCLTEHDKTKLIDNAWTRILLLCMAETAFEFAVTPVEGGLSTRAERETPSEASPTMKDVEHVQRFIRKCQAINLDSTEVDTLKKIVLFSPDSSVVDTPKEIEDINARARQYLLTYVKETFPRGDMVRYSQLLLILQPLYGINCKVIEKLFCKNISPDAHMDVLLKEMIQRR